MRHLRLRIFAQRFERGGVAVIVAVTLMGSAVLLGASAMALDVGNMMFERRQLQNGADAGSRKVAEFCAVSTNLSLCDVTNPTMTGKADSINRQNAWDNRADRYASRLPGNTSGICGRVVGAANMPPCPSDATGAPDSLWAECPKLTPDWANGLAPYVQLYTQSNDGSGTGSLASLLGREASHPTACARYGWGPIKGAKTFPLTFLECEFDEAIGASGGYGVETSLPVKYQVNPTSTSCDADAVPSGGDYNGGFGWLANSNCVVATSVPGWVDGNTGVGSGNACVSGLDVDETYLIPIYTCVSETASPAVVTTSADCNPGNPGGTHTWYYLDRYEAFHITGYKMTSTGGWVGNPAPSAKNECTHESLDNKCLVGYFIKDYVAGDANVDPTNTPDPGGPIAFEHIG